MRSDGLYPVPTNIPVDDGACDHLLGASVPHHIDTIRIVSLPLRTRGAAPDSDRQDHPTTEITMHSTAPRPGFLALGVLALGLVFAATPVSA